MTITISLWFPRNLSSYPSYLLVHLPQVNRGEVDLESALITEGLETDVALHALLPRRRTHVRDADVVSQLLLDLLGETGVAARPQVFAVAALLAAIRARDGRLDSVDGRNGRSRVSE